MLDHSISPVVSQEQKDRASSAVSNATASGKLPRANALSCQECGDPAEQYHHPSYESNKWLDVVPLCRPCHARLHRSLDSYNKPNEIAKIGAFWMDDLGLVVDSRIRSLEDFANACRITAKIGSQINIVQGDLLNACGLVYGDDYFGLLSLCGNEYTAANRKWVMGQTPRYMRHVDLTYSHYAAIAAAWILPHERSGLLFVAARDGISVDDLKDVRNKLWLKKYGDLPYTPTNAREADEAYAAWIAGGREDVAAVAAFADIAPVKRLAEKVRALRELVNFHEFDSDWPQELWGAFNRLVVEIEVVLKELKA